MIIQNDIDIDHVYYCSINIHREYNIQNYKLTKVCVLHVDVISCKLLASYFTNDST